MDNEPAQEASPLAKQQRKETRRQQKIIQRVSERRQNTAKRIFAWLSLFILLGVISAGIIWGSNRPDIAGSDGNQSANVGLELNDSDHILGQRTAPIILVEYADFQCPACAVYHQAISGLRNELGDKVTFVFRHFPLRSIHANADLAAQTVEAANRQGKFWEMANILYERQTDWSSDNQAQQKFIGYARDLGLNEEQFKQDLVASEIKLRIDNDYRDALRLRLNSTPVFFINGQQLTNIRDPAALRQAIEQKLAGNS